MFWFFYGFRSCIKAVIGIIVSSVFVDLTGPDGFHIFRCPIENPESNTLLCALFGGLISGAGSGLAIRFGGAMDGIEVLAVIFAKRLGITVGTFVMTYNVVLYIICGLVINSWILPLYSIVTYMAALKTIDFIVEGFDRSKGVMIVTDKADEVTEALIEQFETGATILSARGGYSKSEKNVVYFIVNRFQISKMRTLVHTIDPKAYMTISEVADVFTHAHAKNDK